MPADDAERVTLLMVPEGPLPSGARVPDGANDVAVVTMLAVDAVCVPISMVPEGPFREARMAAVSVAVVAAAVVVAASCSDGPV